MVESFGDYRTTQLKDSFGKDCINLIRIRVNEKRNPSAEFGAVFSLQR